MGKKYDEREERRRVKKEKKMGEKAEKTNKEKNYDKIWYLKGEKKYIFFPIWTVPIWGKSFWKGGGGRIWLLVKYIPLLNPQGDGFFNSA